MKLKIFGAVLFTAIATVAGWNYSQSQNELKLSDLALANIEALANNEGSCCIGSRFLVTSIPGGWHCQNDQGSSCCPVC